MDPHRSAGRIAFGDWIIAFLKLLYTGIEYAHEAGDFWWLLLPWAAS